MDEQKSVVDLTKTRTKQAFVHLQFLCVMYLSCSRCWYEGKSDWMHLSVVMVNFWTHTRQPETHVHTLHGTVGPDDAERTACLQSASTIYVAQRAAVPIQAALNTALCSPRWSLSVRTQATAPVPSLSCTLCSDVCGGSTSTPTNSRGRCL